MAARRPVHVPIAGLLVLLLLLLPAVAAAGSGYAPAGNGGASSSPATGTDTAGGAGHVSAPTAPAEPAGDRAGTSSAPSAAALQKSGAAARTGGGAASSAGAGGGLLPSEGATGTGPQGRADLAGGSGGSPVPTAASATASPATATALVQWRLERGVEATPTAGPARSGHGTGLQAGRAGNDLRANVAESGASPRGPRPEVTHTLGPYTGTAAFDPGAARSADRGGRSGAPAAGDGERHRAPSPLPNPVPCMPPTRSGLDPTGPTPGNPSADGSGGRTRKDHSPLSVPVTGDAVVPDPVLLLRFLLVLGFRQVRPGNVLDHLLRRAAHAAIGAEPGLDLAGCAAATGANRETLRYHLALLVCCGKVVEETRAGSVRYFPHDPALTPVRRALLHALRNESLATMLAALREAPGSSRGELAARFGVAGPSVTRQVQRLIEDGLVEAERCGRSTCYRLTAACLSALEPALAASVDSSPVRGRASA